MKRIILILLGFCLPVFALAANITDIFNPPAISNATDLSIIYLADIFGVVDGVLHGSGSQILGQMFMVFNAGALALGGIIVIYTSLISLMNTANEGEVLGKKWSSIWIPLRTVLGIGLLIPKATGYCAIQIFMMWVIVQGVGLADTVWNQATLYLTEGGVIIQQSMAPASNVTKATKNILLQSVCLAGLQSLLNTAYQTASKNNQNPPAIPDFVGSINPLQPAVCTNTSFPLGTCTSSCSGNTCTAYLPWFQGATTGGLAPINGFDWSQLNGICGSLTWTNTPTNTAGAAVASAAGSAAYDAYVKSVQVGIQQILLDMSGPAQAFVDNTLYPPAGVPSNANLTNYLNNNMFNQASEDYEGIVYPAQRNALAGAASAALAAWTSKASNEGWINAGTYYQVMANANNNAQGADFSAPTVTTTFVLNNLPVPSTLGSVNTSSLQTELTSSNSALNSFISNTAATGGTSGNTNSTGGVSGIVQSGLSISGQSGAGILSALVSPIVQPLLNIIESFIFLATAQQTNINPVMSIALLGTGLIGIVVEVWVAGAITLAAVTGALDSIPCVNEGNVMNVLVQWIIPFLWGICGMMFAEGITMAFYIPMIPYILFLFGAIGWLMATLEAMVAAPLVALGITHPEGAEVLGKADPAVLMLVNVFLRPSMMIIGFIAGIILSYVSIWLLNIGFWQSFGSDIINGLESGGAIATLFALPAMLILYISLVIGLLNYSFQLINVVPDKVLRWIGGQVEGVAGEAGKMLGESKQGLSQAAQGTGESLKGIAQARGTRADKQKAGGEIDEGGGKKDTAKGDKTGKDLNVVEKK